MNTTNDVIRKLEFLIKNHQNEVAVSYYKWIIKAILLEKEYNQICELSGKRVHYHFMNWLPINKDWVQLDMEDFFKTIYDVHHPIRFSIETFDSIEEIRTDGRWV